jgi:hypothetical protein
VVGTLTEKLARGVRRRNSSGRQAEDEDAETRLCRYDGSRCGWRWTWEPGIETGTGPRAPWYRAREAEATVFHQKLFCWLGWNVLRLPRPINHLGFLLKQTTLTRAMY